jgi:hypothetical protein
MAWCAPIFTIKEAGHRQDLLRHCRLPQPDLARAREGGYSTHGVPSLIFQQKIERFQPRLEENAGG